ncbi:MAG: hypothetical protein CL678_03070 [Bdellovibrionaceae bacterium]|nr:hypothetical protein [Pseudobdellovibrionaceae bacterium]
MALSLNSEAREKTREWTGDCRALKEATIEQFHFVIDDAGDLIELEVVSSEVFESGVRIKKTYKRELELETIHGLITPEKPEFSFGMTYREPKTEKLTDYFFFVRLFENKAYGKKVLALSTTLTPEKSTDTYQCTYKHLD